MFGLFGDPPSFTPADVARLRRVERKLDLILAHLGIAYTGGESDLPEGAREWADRGDKIAAIKAYRAHTGASLAEAKRAIEVYLAERG